MHRYIIKRLLLLIPVIIGVSLFIFESVVYKRRLCLANRDAAQWLEGQKPCGKIMINTTALL